jgi:thioredoxin 1
LEEVATEQAGKLRIAKVDVDANQGLALQYGVQSIPTMIVFKDGAEVHRIIGARGKAQLLEDLDAYL